MALAFTPAHRPPEKDKKGQKGPGELKDERGLYYYPVLENKKLRMYVRLGKQDVQFRLWDSKDPTLWEEHGWVDWMAIQQAAELYKKEGRKGRPPLKLYDIEIAIRLLKDEAEEEFRVK